MFSIRLHARNLTTPLWRRQSCLLTNYLPLPGFLPSKCRTLVTKGAPPISQPTGDLAEQLAATGLWKTIHRGARRSSGSRGDKARVNITDEGLCDDIFSYIGSSLDRHKGCDIIDIYPGVGLWSRKLHDYLQPRSHILMETDVKLYSPFLKPLLDRPNTTLLPKSGLVWRELNEILTADVLPHQPIPDEAQLTKRNDTLLVTANLAFHPKKKYASFDSIAVLILHQFVEAIRSSSLFQRYGLVRMLIWARSGDTTSFLPRTVHGRGRSAISADLSCDWVREVCSPDYQNLRYVRDTVIDAASTLESVERMKAAGMQLPSRRETPSFLEACSLLSSGRRRPQPGEDHPSFRRAFHETLAGLETSADERDPANQLELDPRLKRMRYRRDGESRRLDVAWDLFRRFDDILKLRKSGKTEPGEVEKLEAEWTHDAQETPDAIVQLFGTYRDNIYGWRHKILEWDRRVYEPIRVKPDEVFPNVDCSLLDIQPKAVHPLLRQMGPTSNRASDYFDLILTSLANQRMAPLGAALDVLWPGASDYIMPLWTSIRDPLRGGIASTSPPAQLTSRSLNEAQWVQLLELWMEWPFRPEYHDLIARTQEDMSDKFDEGAVTD